MDTLPVQCPSCCQIFEVAVPPPDEVPCVVDYDCEVCCHPMLLHFDSEHAEAHSLAE